MNSTKHCEYCGYKNDHTNSNCKYCGCVLNGFMSRKMKVSKNNRFK